jgi:hypothetical protein
MIWLLLACRVTAEVERRWPDEAGCQCVDGFCAWTP